MSDEMIELLKSGHINNRLLCEIATHEKFVGLLANAEIYVDGIATMRIRDLNTILEFTRAEIISRYHPQEIDNALRTLEAAQIDEEDYFCHATHKEWDSILHDIRKAHETDKESVPDSSNALEFMKKLEEARHIPGTYLDVFSFIICSELGINYYKLSDKERADIKALLKKSSHFKDSPLGNRKRR